MDWANRDEAEDRARDKARRRVERRLAGLKAIGVTVTRYIDPDEMQLEDAPVDVIEDREHPERGTGIEVRVCDSAPPASVFKALDDVEDVLDDLDLLGDWNAEPDGSAWRGIAIRQPGLRDGCAR